MVTHPHVLTWGAHAQATRNEKESVVHACEEYTHGSCLQNNHRVESKEEKALACSSLAHAALNRAFIVGGVGAGGVSVRRPCANAGSHTDETNRHAEERTTLDDGRTG